MEQDVRIVITSDSKGAITGIRSTSKELNSLGKSSTTHTKNFKKFGDTSTKAVDKLNASFKRLLGFAAVSMVFTRAFNESDKFYKKLAEITVMMKDTTPRAVDSLVKNIDQLSIKSGKSIHETAAGAWQLVSAFGESALQSKKLEIAMMGATAGSAEVNKTISLLSANMKGFGDTSDIMAQKVIDLAIKTNELGQTSFAELAENVTSAVPLFAKLGGEIEELYAIYATLTGVTGNTSEVTTQFTSAMQALVKPSTEAKRIIADLGFESGEAMVKEFGLVGAFKKLVEQTDGSTTAIGKLIIRKEGQLAVTSLLGTQTENFTKKLREMFNVTGTGEKAFDKMTKGVNAAGFAWEQTKVKIEIFMRDLGKILQEIVIQIVRFGDVILEVGAIITAVFVAKKIQAFWQAFQVGQGVFSQLVMGFINLKKYGMSTMDALQGSFRTATGQAFNMRNVLKSIPTSLKISVALVGAYVVGKALEYLADEYGKAQDKFIAMYIDYGKKVTSVTHETTKQLRQFKEFSELYGEAFEYAKEHAEKIITPEVLKNLDEGQKKLLKQKTILMAIQELLPTLWKDYQRDLEKVGSSGNDLNVSLEKNLKTFENLKKTVGNYTEETLDEYLKNLKKQRELTPKQIADLKKIHKQVMKNREEYEKLAASLGVLTKKGYAEQSKEIASLLKIYEANQDQIVSNEETIKKWIDRINELTKTALPEEKKQLEIVKREIESITKAMVPQGRAIDIMTTGLYEFNVVTGETEMIVPGASEALRGFASEAGVVEEKTGDADKKLGDLSETFNNLSGLITGALSALEKMGIGLGGFGDLLGGVASGLTSIGGGLGAIEKAGVGFTGFLQKATGYVSVFTGAFSLGVSIFKGFSKLFERDWKGEAKKMLSGIDSVTSGMEKQLAELAEQIGSTDRAMHQLLATFIEAANIADEADLSDWTGQIIELGNYLSALSAGELGNISEYIEELASQGGPWANLADRMEGTVGDINTVSDEYGRAFSAMIKQADDLGLHGTRAMLDIINQAKTLREEGVYISEVFDYITGQFAKYSENLKKYMGTIETVTAENIGFIESSTLALFAALEKEGESVVETIRLMAPELTAMAAKIEESGLDVSETLQSIFDMSNFIEQNKALADQIDATIGMMEALGSSTYLTEGDFTNFSTEVKRQFDEIIAKTGDQELALRLMAPSFESLLKYAESYGFAIDADTQAIIDMGVESGIVNAEQVNYQEKQIELLEQIVVLLGGDIPDAMENMSQASEIAAGGMRKDIEDYSDTLGNIADEINNQVVPAIQDMGDVHEDVMKGNSIIPEVEEWEKALGKVKDMMKHALPEEMEELEKEHDRILDMIQKKTEKWGDALKYIDDDLFGIGDTVKILDDEYLELVRNIGDETQNIWLRSLEKIENEMRYALPSEMDALQREYDYIMGLMADSTEQLYLSTEGVVMSLREVLKLQGETAAPSRGGRYGVYTEEEKQGMTADFFGMKKLWNENRALIMSSKDQMSAFFRDFQKLEVIDEVKAQYDYWLKSFSNWNAHIQKGHVWNEATRSWTIPETTKAATGFAAMLTKPTDILVGNKRILAGEAGNEMLTITPTTGIGAGIDELRRDRMQSAYTYSRDMNVTDNRRSSATWTRENNYYYNTITNNVKSESETEAELARKMLYIFRNNSQGVVTEMSRQQQKRAAT